MYVAALLEVMEFTPFIAPIISSQFGTMGCLGPSLCLESLKKKKKKKRGIYLPAQVISSTSEYTKIEVSFSGVFFP